MTQATDSIEALVPVCVAEVLETMFFCETEPAPEAGAPAPPVGRMCVEVDFAGAPSGRFWLWLAPAAAKRMAADFLGLDHEEVDEDKAAQTVCELANMICGSIVSRLESHSAFQLSAPRLVDPVSNEAPESRRRFLIDGGGLTVAYRIEAG